MKYQINEKVHAFWNGTLHLGTVLRSHVEKASNGSLSTCYEVSFTNADGTDTVVKIGDMCVFVHPVRFAIYSLISKIKNNLASLSTVYYILNNPFEFVKDISDTKKQAIKMVRVLADANKRRNNLEKAIENDIMKAKEHCITICVEHPKELVDVEEKFIDMKEQQLREENEILQGAETAGETGSADEFAPVFLPVADDAAPVEDKDIPLIQPEVLPMPNATMAAVAAAS